MFTFSAFSESSLNLLSTVMYSKFLRSLYLLRVLITFFKLSHIMFLDLESWIFKSSWLLVIRDSQDQVIIVMKVTGSGSTRCIAIEALPSFVERSRLSRSSDVFQRLGLILFADTELLFEHLQGLESFGRRWICSKLLYICSLLSCTRLVLLFFLLLILFTSLHDTLIMRKQLRFFKSIH